MAHDDEKFNAEQRRKAQVAESAAAQRQRQAEARVREQERRRAQREAERQRRQAEQERRRADKFDVVIDNDSLKGDIRLPITL